MRCTMDVYTTHEVSGDVPAGQPRRACQGRPQTPRSSCRQQGTGLRVWTLWAPRLVTGNTVVTDTTSARRQRGGQDPYCEAIMSSDRSHCSNKIAGFKKMPGIVPRPTLARQHFHPPKDMTKLLMPDETMS